VKDDLGSAPRGRTNWRLFAITLGVPAVAAGTLMAGIAQGAVPAQFAVSGQTFKISADHLEGDGFVQYGGLVVDGSHNPHPVAISGIASAKLTNLCQSVKLPGAPISLVINAGGTGAEGDKATANDLLISMTDLSGDATFKNINIGQDAATVQRRPGKPDDVHGAPGAFGQQADSVDITNLRQTAWATQASEFKLKGLSLKLDVAANGKPKECF
jgi:hypothetical protein